MLDHFNPLNGPIKGHVIELKTILIELNVIIFPFTFLIEEFFLSISSPFNWITNIVQCQG